MIKSEPLYQLLEDRTWDKENPVIIDHFRGTESECCEWIHKHTPFSCDMAFTHQGYSLRPIEQ